MSIETTDVLVEVTKLVVLPAIGFLAGFAAQWLLQERRSRSELLRALADRRAESLCKLWTLTTLPVDVTALATAAQISRSVRERLDRAIFDWYTAQAGALYLSWTATQLLFNLMDLLRRDGAKKEDLEATVSALRSRLKHDCGIYSPSDVKRILTRPRRAPWQPDADSSSDGSARDGAHDA